MDSKVPVYEFPELYQESYLVLLVRDPHCIYAYWELSPDARTDLKQQFDWNWEQQLCLRVFDSTGLENSRCDPPTLCDIAVHPMSDNHFIKDLEANRWYCAELGIILDDGVFLTLIRSGTVHTPRNSIAEKPMLIAKEVCAAGEVGKKELLIGSFASQGIYGDSTG